MMLKFRFNIDFSVYKLKPYEIYAFYVARLANFKQYLMFNLNQSNLYGINTELLNNSELFGITSKFSSDSNFTYKVMIYAIKQLKVISDSSGEYCIGFGPRVPNPFCTKIDFEQLLRIIEFGFERIKPLKLFRHSFLQLQTDTFKFIEDQFGWRRESIK